MEDRSLSVGERKKIYEQLSKSTNNLNSPTTQKKSSAAPKEKTSDPGNVLQSLKEIVHTEKTKASTLETENKSLKEENAALKQKIDALLKENSTQQPSSPSKEKVQNKSQKTKPPKEQPKEQVQEKPKEQQKVQSNSAPLKKNLSLIRANCPNHRSSLAVFISKSGFAGCYECASLDVGIHPGEVVEIEKKFIVESTSKFHLAISSVTVSTSEVVGTRPQEVVGQKLNQADIFKQNVVLNKKIEADHKKKPFAEANFHASSVQPAPATLDLNQIETQLAKATKEVDAFDTTSKQIDIFQYNVKLNQKVKYSAEKQSHQYTPTSATPIPTVSSSTGGHLRTALPPSRQHPTQIPSGYQVMEVESVIGKQSFLVKSGGVSLQNRNRSDSSSPKLTVDSNNLPLAAYAILLLAKTANSFNVEKSTLTQLHLENNQHLSGFSAIARYFARKYDSLNLYSNDNSVEIDSFVDEAIEIKRKNKSDLSKIEQKLKSKSGYLVGNNLTLADLIVWDALRSLELNGRQVALPKDVESWYKNLNSKPELKEAATTLTSSLPSASRSGSSIPDNQEKIEYIKRVMKDFSISHKEAEELWEKFTAGLYPSGNNDPVAQRQENILSGIEALSKKVESLFKQIPGYSQTEEKTRQIQNKNIQDLIALQQQLDKIQGINSSERVAELQIALLAQLRGLEAKTRELMVQANLMEPTDVGKRFDTITTNLEGIVARLGKLEKSMGISSSNCVFCKAQVSEKEFEMFAPKSHPVCTSCYLKGLYVTGSNRQVQVVTKLEESYEERVTSVASEKDDDLVHYYLTLSGYSTEITKVKVLKPKLEKELVLAEGAPAPKVNTTSGTVNFQPGFVSRFAQATGAVDNQPSTQDLEKLESPLLYYLTVNDLFSTASSQSSQQQQQQKQQAVVNKPTQKSGEEIADSLTLYYMVLNDLVGSSSASQDDSSSDTVKQIRVIVSGELGKYKDTPLKANDLKASSPDQEAFLSRWLALYNNPSKSEIDEFVSKPLPFTTFDAFGSLLKNILFGKTFPRDAK